jgi:hypothetical protein
MATDPSLAEEVRLALVSPDEYVRRFQKQAGVVVRSCGIDLARRK